MYFKFLTALTSILVLFGHLAGAFLNFYSTVPNYDAFMHFLGGVWVASSFIFFIKQTLKSDALNGKFFTNLLIVCGVTALAAVFWEFFEFYVNILGRTPANTYTDTLSDLLLGILGSVFSSLILFSKFPTKKTPL